MNKKEMTIFILLFLASTFIFTPFVTSWTDSGESLNVNAQIDSPVLIINVVEDSICLGNLTKGYTTGGKPFNITNSGTIDAIIEPIIPTDEIFSNYLMIANSSSATYKNASGFMGYVGKGKKEDFWIKLDLTDYTGDITGNLSTNLTFIVMPA
jgi:hypothetical protein